MAAITVHQGEVKETQAAGLHILFHKERACVSTLEPNVCI